jgi:hypothetical protein
LGVGHGYPSIALASSRVLCFRVIVAFGVAGGVTLNLVRVGVISESSLVHLEDGGVGALAVPGETAITRNEAEPGAFRIVGERLTLTAGLVTEGATTGVASPRVALAGLFRR